MQVVKQDNKMNAFSTHHSVQESKWPILNVTIPRVALIELCVIPCILKIILSNMCISLNSILCDFYCFWILKRNTGYSLLDWLISLNVMFWQSLILRHLINFMHSNILLENITVYAFFYWTFWWFLGFAVLKILIYFFWYTVARISLLSHWDICLQGSNKDFLRGVWAQVILMNHL